MNSTRKAITPRKINAVAVPRRMRNRCRYRTAGSSPTAITSAMTTSNRMPETTVAACRIM